MSELNQLMKVFKRSFQASSNGPCGILARMICRELAQRLPRIVEVSDVDGSLHDPVKEVMRLHMIQANVPADLASQ